MDGPKSDWVSRAGRHAIRAETGGCPGSEREERRLSGSLVYRARDPRSLDPAQWQSGRPIAESLAQSIGLGLDLAHALGEDPYLALGIGGVEAAISGGRGFEFRDIGSGGLRSLMELVDVADVDVDEGGRVDIE